MGKNYDKVVEAYGIRANLAATNMESKLAQQLTAICNSEAAGKTRSTLALGVIGDHLIVGVQGHVQTTDAALRSSRGAVAVIP